MIFDCIVIGGGPAGLNAALVLVRGNKSVMMFDNQTARNSVTLESHNFITRDGISPAVFKAKGYEDLASYSDLQILNETVIHIEKHDNVFHVYNQSREQFKAENIILATGLKDVLPDIQGLTDVYGKSVFSCPFCDGYESTGEPLVFFAEGVFAFHGLKLLSNWNKDITVCTNNTDVFTPDDLKILKDRGFEIITDEINYLKSDNGNLTEVVFKNDRRLFRKRGFTSARMVQSAPFFEILSLDINEDGRIKTDDFNRTSLPGVYAAGDNTSGPPQLILAAAEGAKAAVSVIFDTADKAFND